MAANKPVGDNARKGAVKKRTQLQTKLQGKKTWTKRDKTTGEFMDQKKAPAKRSSRASGGRSDDGVGGAPGTDSAPDNRRWK
jgi:hypothetical protein